MLTLRDHLSTNDKTELPALTSSDLPPELTPFKLTEVEPETEDSLPAEQKFAASAGGAALAGEGWGFMLRLFR